MKNISLNSVGLLAAWCSAAAATLDTVPMQGGMVMPMISYDTVENRLRVMVNPVFPQLTPLLASNPADNFNPADPWFELLDPSAAGYAFSRRYGFVMDTMTDPLPEGRQIWIRKLGGSPALQFYRYASTEPKAMEPIFGTAGSRSEMAWTGMMFHPLVAAAPGTNQLSASFEAFVADGPTGAELTGTSTGPFTLSWTNLPDLRPELDVARGEDGTVVLSWPVAATNYVLQSSASLGGGWLPVMNSPVLDGGWARVSIAAENARSFYRMERTR